MKHPLAIAISALASLAIYAAPVNAGPRIVSGVFCDTAQLIESFAEAHVGAELPMSEALQIVNRAESRENACAALAGLIVNGAEDTKKVQINGTHLVIRKVTIVGVVVGQFVIRSDAPEEQYALVQEQAETQSSEA